MSQAKRLGDLVGVVGMHFKSDVDGRGVFVFVFDFGFSQRRTAVQTPIDGLQPLVEVAFFEDLAERADLVGFGLEGHRQVGVVPFTQNAEADEVFFLALNLFGGEGAAQLAHLVAGNVFAVQFLDLVFDRQAVAIPARYIRRVESGQRF